jgi:L-threonylcarbamoyladenylate synthase
VTAVASSHRLRLAARWVAAGGVIAYPTEAVYGIGCDPWDGRAVRRVLEIKQRPESKGLILIAADFRQLEEFVAPLAPARMTEVRATWPGPNTWLMPAKTGVPAWLTGSHDTLAVRVTDHPLAAALCRAAGTALVSTSANRSGRPPARSALQVMLRLGPAADYVLVGDCGGRASCSRIRDGLTGEVLRA